MLQLFELEKSTFLAEAYTEGYPSGLRGRFAKSLVRRDLERGFESPLLRQEMSRAIARLFSWLGFFELSRFAKPRHPLDRLAML